MQIVVFPSLQEIGSVNFFENCCAFPFQMLKAMVKKKKKPWGQRVYFLVISCISEKIRSGKSFWNVAMVITDDKITAV